MYLRLDDLMPRIILSSVRISAGGNFSHHEWRSDSWVGSSPNSFASRVCLSSSSELDASPRRRAGTVSPILFPYNPENSISLPPGILTRPIFRGGGVCVCVPKGRRVTDDGVCAYTNSGLICPIKKDPR